MIGKLKAVLVRPTFPGNIGSSLRALVNMGGDELILIDPQCDPFHAESHQAAAGAQRAFAQLEILRNWDEYFQLHPSAFRIALTRRSGKRRKTLDLRKTLVDLAEQAPKEIRGQDLHLFFGPEAHGLEANDMAWCHRMARLPIQGEFASLNLAQAVLLGLFLAREQFPREKNFSKKPPVPPKRSRPKAIDPHMPDESIRRWLTAMGFDIRKRRMSAYLTVRRLLLQNWPSPRELSVLEAILQQNIRKLEKE